MTASDINKKIFIEFIHFQFANKITNLQAYQIITSRTVIYY